MNPGRELDALIAEKVMGCKVAKILDYGVDGNYRYRCDCEGPSPIGTPPHAADSFDNDIKDYSTDIAAAWEVVEKLQREYGIDGFILVGDHSEWRCSLRNEENALATTAPHAICLAALKTLEHSSSK